MQRFAHGCHVPHSFRRRSGRRMLPDRVPFGSSGTRSCEFIAKLATEAHLSSLVSVHDSRRDEFIHSFQSPNSGWQGDLAAPLDVAQRSLTIPLRKSSLAEPPVTESSSHRINHLRRKRSIASGRCDTLRTERRTRQPMSGNAAKNLAKPCQKATEVTDMIRR